MKLKPYRLEPGEGVDLAGRATRIDPPYADHDDYKRRLKDRVKRISRLQRALYAERRSALLVVLQAMDAGGKDGAVRHVFSGVNPQGCRVWSFGPPSGEERRHDWLWRTTQRLPERGMIAVFNRSHYEEMLAVRVHPELLAAEGGPAQAGEDVWKARAGAIRDHERHLTRCGTRVLKLFLHLSKAEQRARLLRRIAEPDHRWKLSASDLAERRLWDDYRSAYEDCLRRTGTDEAPWYVIPADDKPTARLLVAEAVLHALERLDPRIPDAPPDDARELEDACRALEAEGG